jgi:hypothetical protein
MQLEVDRTDRDAAISAACILRCSSLPLLPVTAFKDLLAMIHGKHVLCYI